MTTTPGFKPHPPQQRANLQVDPPGWRRIRREPPKPAPTREQLDIAEREQRIQQDLIDLADAALRHPEHAERLLLSITTVAARRREGNPLALNRLLRTCGLGQQVYALLGWSDADEEWWQARISRR